MSTATTIQNCDARPFTFEGYDDYVATGLYNESEPLNRTCNNTFDSDLIGSLDLITQADVIPFQDTNPSGLSWEVDFPEFMVLPLYGFGSWISTAGGESSVAPNRTLIGIRNPLAAVGVANVGLNHGIAEVLNAQICTIDFCRRDYQVAVNNGIPSVNVSKITYGTKFEYVAYNCFTMAEKPFDVVSLFEFDTAIPRYGSEYLGPTERGGQDMSFCYEQAYSAMDGGNLIKRTMDEFIDGTISRSLTACEGLQCTYDMDSRHNLKNITCVEVNCTKDEMTANLNSADQAYSGFQSSSNYTERINETGLEHVINNAALSLTKYALDSARHNVTGKAGAMVTIVRVEYVWFILPVLLVLMGFGFLCITTWVSLKWELPLWKATLLPLLFQGPYSDAEAALGAQRDINGHRVGQMQDLANAMDVKLKLGADGTLVHSYAWPLLPRALSHTERIAAYLKRNLLSTWIATSSQLLMD